MLAILLLAAMHGERSLRGMWQWAKERERQMLLQPELGFHAVRRLPGLGTFWYALSKLKGGEVETAFGILLSGEEEFAADGKSLRGSKRVGEAEALKVLCLAGTALRQVWKQKQVEGGDEMATAIAVLDEFPLAGKVISADAGILKAPFVQKVVEKRGGISA
jgi:hypothetical protein